MFKRIAIALAGLFAVLSLAAAPSAGAAAADTATLTDAFNQPETLDILPGCRNLTTIENAISTTNNSATRHVELYAMPGCVGLVAVVPANTSLRAHAPVNSIKQFQLP